MKIDIANTPLQVNCKTIVGAWYATRCKSCRVFQELLAILYGPRHFGFTCPRAGRSQNTFARISNIPARLISSLINEDLPYLRFLLSIFFALWLGKYQELPAPPQIVSALCRWGVTPMIISGKKKKLYGKL